MRGSCRSVGAEGSGSRGAAAAVDVELMADDLARIEAELPQVAGARCDEVAVAAVNL